jgi:hypothetical protein
MSTSNASKISQLMQLQPRGTVLLSSWLIRVGYSRELQKRYKSSKWLESIGTGAMKRTGDQIPFRVQFNSLITTELYFYRHIIGLFPIILLVFYS